MPEGFDLWGSKVQPKNSGVNKTEKPSAQPKQPEPEHHDAKWMREHAVTENSVAAHFAIQLNLLWSNYRKLEGYYQDLIERASFEEKKRIELVGEVKKLQSVHDEIRSDLEEMSNVVKILSGLGEGEGDEEDEQLSSPETEAAIHGEIIESEYRPFQGHPTRQQEEM